MSKLLIDDQPLQVLPRLAEAIGLNEAIVLQQVHWCLTNSRNVINGRTWVFNKYEDWKESHFRFWSISTIRRAFEHLESLGLVLSTDEFNRMKMDKTKWYTIDYDALERLELSTAKNDSPSVQNEQSSCSKWQTPSVQNEQHNNQERSQERSTRDLNNIPPSQKNANSDPLAKTEQAEKTEQLQHCFERFWSAGLPKTNKPTALKRFKSAYESYDAEFPISLEDFTAMLVADIGKRLRLRQFGFDKLHPTTYLNNWRWLDDYPQPDKPQFSDENTTWWQGETIEIYGANP